MLTHLLGQKFEDVAEKIRAYRMAWREAGHPGNGKVSLMLHTFVGDDEDEVRETVREPMKEYLKSSVDLLRRASWSSPTFKQKADATGVTPQEVFEKQELTDEETEALLDHAFERYYQTSGLFGTPETKIGLFPATILTYMLRILPRRKLMEMCITGEPFSAAEALDMGLVNYVVSAEELDRKVDWLLNRIVDKSPTGVRLGKAGLHAMQDMTMREALEYTQLLLPFMSQSEDAAEGMAAFTDKRAPDWPGR